MKTIYHAIQVVDENCTGCHRCERVCPTSAITMVGPSHEALAVVAADQCIACMRCLDSCDDDAMLVVERAEPIELGLDFDEDDPAIAELCAAAGMDPELLVCACSNTQAKEVAAGILSGSTTFESLALTTGVQSGCLIYCSVPLRRLLLAHHGQAQTTSQVRRVPLVLSLRDVADELEELYPTFGVAQELRAVRALPEPE